MTKIALITAPKPFTDPHISLIQMNAIKSWKALGKDVEILMMGDEDGMEEISNLYSLKHFKNVECSDKGIPYIGSMFETAKNYSNAEIIAFVNSDIILFSDFVKTGKFVHRQLSDYLIVGQRWDYDEIDEINPVKQDWENNYRGEVVRFGKLHYPTGSDYFIFPRHLYSKTPNFSVGRAGWDNWMIYHGVTSPWPAIDASKEIMIVHQNHDYSHLPGGKVHYKLEETFKNQSLGGGRKNMFSLADVNKVIKNQKIKNPPFTFSRMLRLFEKLIYPLEEKGIRWKILILSEKARKKINMSKFDYKPNSTLGN